MGSILRGIVAYLFLLLTIRVTTRRAAGPGTPFELILIFMLGGMMIQSVVSDDRSVTGAALGVMTVGWMHMAMSFLKSRSNVIGRIVDGVSVPLVEAGRWHTDRLSKLGLNEQDVLASARQNGLEDASQIRGAVFERNGAIVVYEHHDA